VDLLDIGSTTLRDREIPYLDFEFIAGGDLDFWIRVNGKVAEREAVDLASGLLQGVAALHKVHVLHRDIKPANIGLRDGDPRQPVLLDLGLAKLLDLESITRYPSHIGTAMYMSPEQLRGERAVKGSDVWAVGVVLHEVLTGRHPFFERLVNLRHFRNWSCVAFSRSLISAVTRPAHTIASLGRFAHDRAGRTGRSRD
jgi:serine/threonine-protein kinase